MDQTQRQAAMGFTDERFPMGTHMCLIYDDEEKRRKVIGRFLEAGLHESEKIAYFVDTMEPAEVDSWLSGMGVDMSGPARNGRFSITVAEKTYCPDGKFAPEAMLSTLRTFHRTVLEQGYKGSRVSGEMSWALRGIPGSDRLIEYEALVNDVLVTHPVTAICQYDARRFSGEIVFDVLKVHPMMIVHGQVVKNPYYVRPQEFLRPAKSPQEQR